jgi:hypothetical protein
VPILFVTPAFRTALDQLPKGFGCPFAKGLATLWRVVPGQAHAHGFSMPQEGEGVAIGIPDGDAQLG